MKLAILFIALMMGGCSTLFPNRTEDCKQTCLKLMDKNERVEFKAETDEHFCSCEGERL